MINAAAAGRSKIVELVAAQGADVNAGGPNQWKALQWAAWGGHEETVRLLLDLGSDPTAGDSTGRTAAQLAAENGHPSVARLLLVSAREWRLLHR